MKTLTLFFALAIISLTGFSQKSYLELRKEYQHYCDSVVTDTITETGTITYEAKQINGEIKFSIIDTVWRETDCREYKNYGHENYSNYTAFTGKSSSILTLTTSDGAFYSQTTKAKQTMTITRQKYCQMKWLKGNEETFYEWVTKNYLK